MSEVRDARSVVQSRRHRMTVARSIMVLIALIAITLLSPNSRIARAAPLTDEVRAAFIKSAEENCFDGQSKQEANKSRQPEQLHALCSCLGEKMSYTMTMERLIAAVGKPFTPTAEDEQLMRAVFDNCWQVNVK